MKGKGGSMKGMGSMKGGMAMAPRPPKVAPKGGKGGKGGKGKAC